MLVLGGQVSYSDNKILVANFENGIDTGGLSDSMISDIKIQSIG